MPPVPIITVVSWVGAHGHSTTTPSSQLHSILETIVDGSLPYFIGAAYLGAYPGVDAFHLLV